jgi:hypothetical protein
MDALSSMEHQGPTDRRRRFALAALALSLAACTGAIGGAGTPDPADPASPATPGSGGRGGSAAGPSAGGAGGTSSSGTGGSAARPASKLPRGALLRLTSQQYGNTVRDLLGARITVPPVEPDPSSDDDFVLTSVAVATVVPSHRAVDQYDAAARELARQVFADPARRQELVGCAPATADDTCIKRFLGNFGRRAWRRPLTDEEIGRYAKAVSAVAQGRNNDVWAGLETAVTALLSSPYFLYRVELGTPAAPSAARRTLDDHELATRLSYTLLDTTPDVALLDAADRGDLLKKPEVLRATIERLLASPGARRPLLTFFSEWLGTSGLDRNGLAKDAKLFPDATLALARGMYQEIDALVADAIWGKNVDLLSLYGTRETFLTAELAKLYGLPAGAVAAGAQPSPFTLPEGPRGGLLTTGAFLSLNARASITSPTLRGVFIRERLLCQPVPPPPPTVDTTLPPPPPGAVETMRERLTRHRMDPACESCHRFMDPLGLALENFDALGAFRALDGGKPIDPSGEMDGKRFDGPQALQKLVREHEAAAPCVVSNLIQYLTGTGDAAVAESLAAALAPTWKGAGGRVKGFLASYLESELFRTLEDAP